MLRHTDLVLLVEYAVQRPFEIAVCEDCAIAQTF
jgi:hypothetical protein